MYVLSILKEWRLCRCARATIKVCTAMQNPDTGLQSFLLIITLQASKLCLSNLLCQVSLPSKVWSDACKACDIHSKVGLLSIKEGSNNSACRTVQKFLHRDKVVLHGLFMGQAKLRINDPLSCLPSSHTEPILLPMTSPWMTDKKRTRNRGFSDTDKIWLLSIGNHV